MAGPGGLAAGPIKPQLHAFYPADGGPAATQSLDYDAWKEAQAAAPAKSQFTRDYGTLIERAEAEFATNAAADVPELRLLREGAGILAETLEGQVLVPDDLGSVAGQERIAVLTLALLSLRTVRTCAMLIASGSLGGGAWVGASAVCSSHRDGNRCKRGWFSGEAVFGWPVSR